MVGARSSCGSTMARARPAVEVPGTKSWHHRDRNYETATIPLHADRTTFDRDRLARIDDRARVLTADTPAPGASWHRPAGTTLRTHSESDPYVGAMTEPGPRQKGGRENAREASRPAMPSHRRPGPPHPSSTCAARLRPSPASIHDGNDARTALVLVNRAGSGRHLKGQDVVDEEEPAGGRPRLRFNEIGRRDYSLVAPTST
jgi:hypothetical protein